MNFMTGYKKQVELLLDVLPLVQHDPRFALKGGTAINLFYRNMPRLSVDIDLTYLPIEPRETFLNNLTSAMQELTDRIEQKGFFVDMKKSEQHILKLIVSNQNATIVVEPNTILRGTVFEPEVRELVEDAQNTFLQTQKAKIISIADLYGGKICAALDRQHPRDFFDIKLLFEHEGITTPIRQAFIVYLASSPRPMNELLSPNELDVQDVFHKEFTGMTGVNFNYVDLCDTRQQLIKTIQESLTSSERAFLISIKSGEPQWDLMPISGLSKLPGLLWKVINVQKMDKAAREITLSKLKRTLNC